MEEKSLTEANKGMIVIVYKTPKNKYQGSKHSNEKVNLGSIELSKERCKILSNILEIVENL